jgi:hypothetical protein
MAFDVFISYSSKDAITANAACATLESAGIRCWIAPRDIRPGLEYGGAIIEGIDACRVMVLVFSSNANASQQVHREIERAVSKGLTIIPFRIEGIAPTKAMEYYLGSIHWLDALTPPLARHLQQLAETVRTNLQIDPVASPPLDSVLPKVAPKTESGFLRSNFWSPIGGLAALILLGAAALAIWQTHTVLEKLFSKPTPAATATQQILLNILRASYNEPLDFSPNAPGAILQRPVSLDQLNSAIRDGYSREMLYWLFVDSFKFTLPDSTVFGYRYNPPDDYGCSQYEPKRRCFIDWIHIATLTGLTVEEKSALKKGAEESERTTYARFCFDQFLAQQARATMSPALIQASAEDFDVPASSLYASSLTCGADAWDPLATANSSLPYRIPLFLDKVTLEINPRSANGIFRFLGTLTKLQRDHVRPSNNATIAAGRDDAVEPPSLTTVHDDPNLLTIVPKGTGLCFAEAHFNNIDYCVPNTATTTENIFNFLIQLTGIH